MHSPSGAGNKKLGPQTSVAEREKNAKEKAAHAKEKAERDKAQKEKAQAAKAEKAKARPAGAPAPHKGKMTKEEQQQMIKKFSEAQKKANADKAK